MLAQINVGTSGWHYSHWRGPFYPERISSAQMLEFYCRRFRTVEINSSFYHLPKKETFRARTWLAKGAKEVFFYFDNDQAGYAALNAQQLQEMYLAGER